MLNEHESAERVASVEGINLDTVFNFGDEDFDVEF